MKRILSGVVKFFGALAGGIVILILAAALSIMVRPGLVINNATWRAFQTILARSGVGISEKQLDVRATSLSFLTKKLTLHFEGLCVNIARPDLHGCFPLFEVNVVFRIQKPALRVVEVGPILITSDFFRLNLKPGPPEPEKAQAPARSGPGFVREIFPPDLRVILLHPIELNLKNNFIRLVSGVEFSGDVLLSDRRTLEAPAPWSARLQIKAQELTTGSGANIDWTITGRGRGLRAPVTVQGPLIVSTKSLAPARFDFGAELFGPSDAFSLGLRARRACFSGNFPLKGCVQELAAGIEGTGNLSEIQITGINPLILKARTLTADLRPKGIARPAPVRTLPQAKVRPPFPAVFWPPVLGQIRIKNVDVALNQAVVRTSGGDVSGPISLRNLPVRPGEHWALELRVQAAQARGPLKIGSRWVLRQSASRALGRGRLELTGAHRLKLKSDLTVQVSDNRHLNCVLKWDGGMRKWTSSGRITGVLVPTEIRSRVEVMAAKGQLRVELPCQWRVEKTGLTTATCEPQAHWEKSGPMSRIQGFPDHLNLSVRARLKAPFPYSTLDPWTGSAVFAMEPLDNPLLGASGKITASLNHQVLARGLWDKIRIEDDLHVVVKEFKKLSEALKDTDFAPPAPVNVLQGKLELTSRGALRDHASRIPIFLSADLSSPQQAMKFVAQAQFGLKRQNGVFMPRLDGELVLNDVQLILPRLGIGLPPPFFPDSRIQRRAAQAPAPSSVFQKAQAPPPSALTYCLAIRTGEHPIRLVSNLTEKPIPIAVNLKVVSGNPVKGKVRLETFPVSLFRRHAQVNFLEISLLSPRSSDDPISGDAVLTYTDYVIHILLTGTMGRPVVKFESDPPLPQDQIISVILFGQPPGNLTTDQSSSVGNMQAALSDRALGLASLYFLAATPVESVGYDPQSGLFTAKIRLSSDVSLDVGSATGSSLGEIGLNKRLGHSWYIRTFYTNTNPTTGETQSVTAFLEKVFRY